MTTLASATFLQDAILFMKDQLTTNITDPISTTRPTGQEFVMTEFPKRAVVEPYIVVRDAGMADIQRLGMQSEGIHTSINIEVHIFAKNVNQRDQLSQQIYQFMRTNQFADTMTDNQSTQFGLHDLALVNMINLPSIPGDGGIRRKVLEYKFALVLT